MGLGRNDRYSNQIEIDDSSPQCLDNIELNPAMNENSSQQHQHYFSLCKPLRQINVYHGSNSFSTAIRVKGLMSVVKCEGCSLQFISMTEQNEINKQKTEDLTNENIHENNHKRKISSVEETLAAYYNTSQISSTLNDT